MSASKLQQADTFGDWGKIAIAKYFAKTIERESQVLADKDVEALHQMRVGMRSLRSAISLFSPALILPKTVSERKIAKIAKILGKLRDIDVLQDTLDSQYKPLLPPEEKKQLHIASKKLARQRKVAVKKVRKILKSETYRNLKQDLQQWLQCSQHTAVAAISIEDILPDLLSIQVSQLLMHPGWLVGTKIVAGEISLVKNHTSQEIEKIARDRDNPLHDLRKEIKKTRYNLTFFTEFYSNTYRKYLKKIELAQEVLGNIQDSIVLEKFLAKSSHKKICQQMPTMITILRKTRSENWQTWLQLQAIFCDYRQRQELRSILHYPQR